VGEKITRAIELATETRRPIIIVSGSGGGARMQEGVLSLSQMAKTSAALSRLDDTGGIFVSVLTNPTMGGVAASFAALGDVIIAEPKALIGFAGPRTIWHTLKIELPEGFQSSEFLLEHGFVDMIVNRGDLKKEISRILDYFVAGDIPVRAAAAKAGRE
jgi:acetyl-CoA carboxylase carboxyl transferase subunit beta